jgi:hypothetical protein
MLILSLSVLLGSIALKSSPVQDTMTYGEYGPYYPEYYPYSTYLTHGQYDVAIQISGLPPEYSTNIKIDGMDAGDVQGGSSKNFEVRSTEAHVFEANGQIPGLMAPDMSVENLHGRSSKPKLPTCHMLTITIPTLTTRGSTMR